MSNKSARHEVDPQQGMRLEAGSSTVRRLSFAVTDPRAGEGQFASWGKGNAGLWPAWVTCRSGFGAPAAAQEPARMTRDVLDRLLAACSSDRPADICDRAVLLPQRPATRHRRPYTASPFNVGAQGRCPRRGGEGASCGRVGEWLERGARLSGHRPQESGGRKSVTRLSINLIVERR